MKESERKSIVNKIEKGIREKNSLGSKYDELKKLTKNPFVARYLELLEDINRIEDNLKIYGDVYGKIDDSLEKRIRIGFKFSTYSCDHSVWLYAGSYYKFTNFAFEEDYERNYSENLSDSLHTFSYNEYICLECGKSVKIPASDWENFENTHLVLKMNERIDFESYQNFYFQLLYLDYGFADAQQLVIDVFNKNKENVTSSHLIRKKGK